MNEASVIYKSCPCGKNLTLAEWLRLPLIGRKAMEPGEPVLEYRNHDCGSTIVIEMPAKPKADDDMICAVAAKLRAAGNDHAASEVLKLRFEP